MNESFKSEVFEGTLRINLKNYEEAYVSIQDEEIDILINGTAARNQALNGDLVAVRLNPPSKWRILYDTLRDNWEQWKVMFDVDVEPVEDDTPVNQTSDQKKKKKRHRFHSKRNKSEGDQSHLDTTHANPRSNQLESNGIVCHINMKVSSLGLNTKHEKVSASSSSKGESDPNTAIKKRYSRAKNKSESDANIADGGVENFPTTPAKNGHDAKRTQPQYSLDPSDKLPEQCINSQSSDKPSEIPPSSSKKVKGLDKRNALNAKAQELHDKELRKLERKANKLLKKQNRKDLKSAYKSSASAHGKTNSVQLDARGAIDANDSIADEPKCQKHENQPNDLDAIAASENNVASARTQARSDVSHEIGLVETCDRLDKMNINGSPGQKKRVRTQEEIMVRKEKKERRKKERKASRDAKVLAEEKEWSRHKKFKGKKSSPPPPPPSSASKKTPSPRASPRASSRASLNGCENKVLETPKRDKSNGKQFKSASNSPKVWSARHSDSIAGLPRDLLALSPAELLKYPFGKWCVQKTGKVSSILEKNHSRTCCGTISVDGSIGPNLKFVPSDSRIPRLLIPVSQCPENIAQNLSLYSETLFLARITDWPPHSQMPFGEIVSEIGQMGKIEAETRMLLTENDVIDEPFPEEVESDLANKFSTWTISDEERSKRKDFTNHCVFTIDPLTARDLDDALSITPLPSDSGNQLYEVGVHIADVSFFIPEGSLLDQEAQRRSTSFYLVHKVIHMLPRILSEKACSLTPGEEKLTFSVVWTMDINGKVHDTWFGRSIIRSCIKLAYEHAFEMITNGDSAISTLDLPPLLGNQWKMTDICEKVNLLNQISSSLRKKRFDGGALEINKTKLSFALDSDTGLPSGLRAQISNAAHSLVEELMLLANISVAKRIFQFKPDLALLRCHPRPDGKLLRELNAFCSNYGIKVDSSTSLSLQQSLTPIKKNEGNLYRVVSQFLLRAMPVASYFCSGQTTDPTCFHHFALNERYYTHFTSPIRRYPDIIVHRLLAASLEYQDIISVDSVQLQEIANHCNKRKTASRLVSEGSQKFFMLLFVKSVPRTDIAVVTGVLDRAFDVIIVSLDLKCRIYMDQLEGGTYKYACKHGKKTLTITWNPQDGQPSKEQIINLANEVSVLVTVTDETPMKVKASLIRP